MTYHFLVILLLFHAANAQPHVVVSKGSSGDVTFTIPDQNYALVALHFSINQPISGVAAGQYNVDIPKSSKTGSAWIYTSDAATIKNGDVVNYWVLVIQNGEGKQLLNQQWTCCGGSTDGTNTGNTNTGTNTGSTNTGGTNTGNTNTGTNTGTNTNTGGTNTGGTANIGGSNTGDTNTNTGSKTNGGNNNGGKDTNGINTGLTGSTVNTGGTDTGDNTTNTGGINVGGTNTGGNVVYVTSGTAQLQCSSYPCLAFEDNFDTFNFDVWEHEISAAGGGNWEFQYYLNNRSNSYVKDGKLFIKPTLTADKYGEPFLATGSLDLWGFVANDVCTGNMFYGCKRAGDGVHYINPIQSARLRSIRGFSMKYGKLEVEAKMPKGDWIWPAIWLLPKWNRYGGWPSSGEIDLCESRGNERLVDEKGKSIGANAMGSTLHFGPDYWHNGWSKAHKEKILSSGSFADGFHKFVLEWDENGIRTTVDGDEVLNVRPDDGGFYKIGEFEKHKMENPWRNSNSKMAPFDQEFYIILNVAIGGTGDYFSDNLNGKPWRNVGETASKDFWNARGAWYPTWNPDKNDGEDAAMQVNYIRYWKLKP